ncbi:MAG: polyprenyl synthetase family protein [Verrucomicrobiae bacterium]|nr:polyprenyl synthetase family protein [Verrucomicrobiae bacterium]
MKIKGQKILESNNPLVQSVRSSMVSSAEKKAASTVAELFWVVSPQIEQVESHILEQIGQFDPGVRSYLTFALETHGKRLRPALAFLSGGMLGATHADHLRLATIVELIHLATLVHDDIIDEASIRRGQPTVQRRWGAASAVLIGDCIFAHALRMATDFEVNVVNRTIAAAASEVCQGEVLQTQRRFDFTLTIAEYYKLIEMKTGALFRVSCELGAFLSGANATHIAAMRDFGTHLGVAYQIWDDLIDLYGRENKIGKSLGSDLDKGKLTLPLLQLLRKADAGEHGQLSHLLLSESESDKARVIRLVVSRGCLDESIDAILDSLNAAEAILQTFAENEHRRALAGLLSFLKQESVALRLGK